MKVGVVIPYYENSTKAKERLEFLLYIISQSPHKHFYITLICNGKSPDWIKNINTDVDIHYLSMANVSSARNLGIEHCILNNCKYIGFLDADDTISCDFFKEAYNLCKQNVYDYIDCRFVQSGQEVFGTLNGTKHQYEIVRCGVTGTFFKTDVIKNHRFNEHKQIGEDCEFTSIIDLKKHKKGISNGVYVYCLGVNPNSLIMRRNRGEIKEEI